MLDSTTRFLRPVRPDGRRMRAEGLAAEGNRLAGMAVHIAARIQAAAAPGEILVSSTVKDLAVGSAIRFTDRGETSLKSVPEPRRLFAVAD